MTTTRAKPQPRAQERAIQVYDSDFEYPNRYIKLQMDLKEFYTLMQDFVKEDDFKMHIRKDGYNLNEIEEQLKFGKNDVMKTECPIVIAGETSAGKSSVVNLILGEKILPSGIRASTSRVCRVKYCEQLMISTRDNKGEELANMSFDNVKEMAENLKMLAKTNDKKISCVDIYMPVPLLQGNVIIVDTPGCGDKEQKEVADKMMSYLPNALAFVFVINVSNAGGLQDDRILPVLSKVKDSMNSMVSFSPKDVIFLLNKWDTISNEDDDQLESFMEETKECLHKWWKDVDDSCIFRTSATKVSEDEKAYIQVFEKFREALKDVITRNKNKRIKIHIKFLKDFLDEFHRVLTTKLAVAKQSTDEIETNLDRLATELGKLENSRKEESLNIERNIETFLDNASHQLHCYLHHNEFRTSVLNDTDNFTRVTIGKALDARIEKETIAWQNKHIDEIFQKTIMKDLKKKFENIHRTLHSIKDNLKGMKTPFDVENRITTAIASGVIPSGAGLLGSFLINRKVSNSGVMIGIATAGILSGIVLSSLVTYDVIDIFEVVREKAFEARINAFTKKDIMDTLRKEYFESIKKIIRAFLEGDLENEIIKIKENIITMKNQHEFFKSEEKTLSLLQSTVIQKIERLQQIGRIDITTE